MKKSIFLLGMTALALQGAFAIITVPANFPMAGVSGDRVTQQEKLALLVSRYENDVVLLINPADAYSKEIRNTVPTPATSEKLKALAASGGAVTADSLAAAVTAMVRQSPADAPVIVASAVDLLKGVPGGRSAENREKIARAAIRGLPEDIKDESRLIAFIIGVSAQGLNTEAVAALVKSLRGYAIGEAPTNEQTAYALSVDEAMVNEGILSPYAASPEFLAMADNFASGQLGETFFSGDQGAINQGAVFSPGAAGSAGGAGNVGNQGSAAEPTPTPPPPAS